MVEWYLVDLEVLGYMGIVFFGLSFSWLLINYLLLFFKKYNHISIKWLIPNIVLTLVLTFLLIFWFISLYMPEAIIGYDISNEKKYCSLLE